MEKAYITLSNTPEAAVVDKDKLKILSQYIWRGRKSHGKIKYAVTGKTGLPMHRVVWGKKILDGYIIDHINNNGLDNRLVNLRVIKKEQNAWNRKAYKGRKFKGTAKISGTKGGGKQYQARIRVDKVLIYLGSFYTEEEAARTYDEHARLYFGDLACLNFPTKCED